MRSLKTGIPLAVFLIVGSSVSGQITSTIHGVVKQSDGAVLPGASVTVESPALRRGAVTVTTDGVGRYRVPGLQPGVYSLKVELQGFAPVTLTGITLEVNADVPVDVTMELAAVRESVTVTAEAPIVRTKESALGVQIDTRVIDNIPLNGRQFLDLISLVPGVAPRPQSSDQGAGVTVFGERSITNSFLVDGLDNNDLFSRDFSEFFVQDAIQEFKVLLAGYQAEFGRASGAVTNVITRSGTNDLRGRAFLFTRDDRLDASNIEGQDPPELTRVEVGGTLGGPIRRNKTYLFDAFQFFRERRGLNFDRSILPPIINDGYFSPTVRQEPFDRAPIDKRYTNFARVDHQFNNENQIFVTSNVNRVRNRFFIPNPNRGFAAPPPGTLVLPSINSDIDADTTSVNARYTTFFNTNTFLESSLRVSSATFAENKDKPQGAEQLFPITFVPTFQIWMSNASPVALVDRKQDRIQWSENLSYFKAGHSLKFGVDVDRTKLDHIFLPSTGIIHGNSALDGRYRELGYLVTMQRFVQPPIGRDHAQATNVNTGLFVQDSWEPAPGLTLNVGVRYDYASLFSDDQNNVAPRLGVTYDIGQNGKTVIRAAYGRFFDQTILEAVVETPELGGVQYGTFDLQVIPRGGSFFNNPSIGAFGPLQDSGTRWLSNPKFYSYMIPVGQVRSSGGISISGLGQPYIVYDLLGIAVADPRTPPPLTFGSISTLTGGRLTPQQALAILNAFFPGPRGAQFDFLSETGPNSLNTGRPLIFKFRQLQPEVAFLQTIQHPQRTPYTDSFNVGVEQALGPDLSLDVEVFVRRSKDLLARRVVNLLEVPIAGDCSGNTVDGGPCNRQLQYIGFLDANAVTVSLRKRHSHGHSFLASYTFTDATDNFSTLRVPPTAGETSFLFNNHPERDIGRSLNTPEHVFVFSGLYELPYDISVSGVLRATSGRPFNAAGLPLDTDGDNQFDNRLLGTEKGGFLTDPFVQADLRLAKEFGFTSRQRATILIEFFNITNRANPFIVNTVVGPRLGDTVQPYPGREVQIGFRFDF